MSVDVRRHEKNRLEAEIRQLRKCVERDDASIRRINGQPSSSYGREHLDKLKAKNCCREEQIEAAEDRLKKVGYGELDDELHAEQNRTTAASAERSRVTRQRKEEASAVAAKQSVVSKAYYQANRQSDRTQRNDKRGQQRAYQHFVRASNSMPDYMKRNLADMPNNKGYFWKSVACYGKRPAEVGKPTVLFDRKRGGVMVIHEWTDTEYKIYHKHGKDKKILHSSQQRKPKRDNSWF